MLTGRIGQGPVRPGQPTGPVLGRVPGPTSSLAWRPPLSFSLPTSIQLREPPFVPFVYILNFSVSYPFVEVLGAMVLVNKFQLFLNGIKESIQLLADRSNVWSSWLKALKVIMDSATNFMVVGRLLEKTKQFLFCIPCMTHYLDLIIEDVGKMPG
ncbi:hypothetical protein EJ110_NYTH29289 [Nymphaea thermarum]|nr:hypothetical protein EJ110_NYTH29289 [Nymphaea thermarum]